MLKAEKKNTHKTPRPDPTPVFQVQASRSTERGKTAKQFRNNLAAFDRKGDRRSVDQRAKHFSQNAGTRNMQINCCRGRRQKFQTPDKKKTASV